MSPKHAGMQSLDREKAAGRYEVLEQLAKGGMGAIYRAHDRLAQREVAYKRLDVSTAKSRARKIVHRDVSPNNVRLTSEPAGDGRSALLEAFVLQAQLRGALVQRAKGDRSTGPFDIARSLAQLALLATKRKASRG